MKREIERGAFRESSFYEHCSRNIMVNARKSEKFRLVRHIFFILNESLMIFRDFTSNFRVARKRQGYRDKIEKERVKKRGKQNKEMKREKYGVKYVV